MPNTLPLSGTRQHFTVPFLFLSVATVLLYIFYLYGLGTNPPGFFLDESCLAYNAYLISQTGTSEFGVRFPLFFQCFTDVHVQYANPTHIYLLALPYLVFSPSVLTARIFAATMVFAASILLGVLSCRISGRREVGVIVAVTAIFTPWLFEISRLVLEVFFYPLAVVLFLLCLHQAYRRGKWKLVDNVLLASTLALLTYSYTIGRLLGPLLAFGLIIFAVNKLALWGVIKTWLLYGLTLIPLIAVYFLHPEVIVKRFNDVSYLFSDKPIWEIAGQFAGYYFEDISLRFLLFEGDQNLRHHVPGMGEILLVTIILAVAGIVLILVRHRANYWWRYVLYGLFVSVIPGALTGDRFHSLRMVAFPIFLLLVTVPALSWLLADTGARLKSLEYFRSRIAETDRDGESRVPWWRGVADFDPWRGGVLILLLAFTLVQAVFFQRQFQRSIPNRGFVFDSGYSQLLNEALSVGVRPVYLEDGVFGPAYIHGYWYGAILGVDRSNFVHLEPRELPPEGSIVLSSNDACSNCEIMSRQGNYILYTKSAPNRDAQLVK